MINGLAMCLIILSIAGLCLVAVLVYQITELAKNPEKKIDYQFRCEELEDELEKELEKFKAKLYVLGQELAEEEVNKGTVDDDMVDDDMVDDIIDILLRKYGGKNGNDK